MRVKGGTSGSALRVWPPGLRTTFVSQSCQPPNQRFHPGSPEYASYTPKRSACDRVFRRSCFPHSDWSVAVDCGGGRAGTQRKMIVNKPVTVEGAVGSAF